MAGEGKERLKRGKGKKDYNGVNEGKTIPMERKERLYQRKD